MQYCVVATVLLSTFVFAQANKSSVVIENSDDLNSNSEAKTAFCGIVSQCDGSSEVSKSSAFQKLKNRVDELEKQSKQFKNALQALTNSVPLDRFSDYKQIANLKPVFWLSGTFYDGFNIGATSLRTGLAPATDVLGNGVTRIGSVVVTSDRGQMAYMFDKTNSITSSASVSTQFTFAVVFRFPTVPTGDEGRFFTSPNGNKLFAGWVGNTQELYIEGWINENGVKTNDTVILIGTNQNGVKNLWTHNKQLVVNSNIGANDWGRVVIGRPGPFSNEAAQVNVYEAIAFDKVLNADQRNNLVSVLKKWYKL